MMGSASDASCVMQMSSRTRPPASCTTALARRASKRSRPRPPAAVTRTRLGRNLSHTSARTSAHARVTQRAPVQTLRPPAVGTKVELGVAGDCPSTEVHTLKLPILMLLLCGSLHHRISLSRALSGVLSAHVAGTPSQTHAGCTATTWLAHNSNAQDIHISRKKVFNRVTDK